MIATSGTQQCGGFFTDESFRVTGCTIALTASDTSPTVPLTVRVWTSLDGDASDESFGIDNVVVTKLDVREFENYAIANLVQGERGEL